MDLKPAFSVKTLILRSTVGRSSLRFGEGSGELKLVVTVETVTDTIIVDQASLSITRL